MPVAPGAPAHQPNDGRKHQNEQQAEEQSLHLTRPMRAMRSVLPKRQRGTRKLLGARSHKKRPPFDWEEDPAFKGGPSS